MKFLLLLCLCTIVYGYDGISDDIDVDYVFTHPDKEKEYLNCFTDKGPCTESMALQKTHIKQIIEDVCHECTASQRSKTIKALKYFVQKYPQDLMEMRVKYDPEGKYFDNFLKLMLEDQ